MTIPGEEAILEAARAEGRKKLRAGIYTRMSLARMDDQTKVADQERIGRELAGRRGDMEVVEVYCDNNKSAWRHDRKRPGWERMLADVEAGKLDAIIVYHGDRLIRQPMDLEKLLELSRGKGVRLASPTGDRNLDSSEDQFILGIEANMARRESANISRRQKARFERQRREGRVMAGGKGGRRFGYTSDGLTLWPADRCDVAARQLVSEADVIREMAERTLTGEAAGLIERDVVARGWLTPAGKRFQHGAVRRLLTNPRYAGLMPDGESAAAWPAILDRDTWERVCLVIGARAARHPRGVRPARWLLSGIAVCGQCGRPLRSVHISSRGYRSALYGCEKREGGCGKVYRNAKHLDAYVSTRTVARLGNPLNPEARMPRADFAAEWVALGAERAATEQLLGDYRASAGRATLLMSRLDSIDARIAELRELAAGDGRSRLLDKYRGISQETFDGLPLDVRRALVAACFTVTVLPASGRGPGFRVEDVRVEPLG